MQKPEGKVLICEEDPAVSHCLEMAVKSFGYCVQSTLDGSATISVLQERDPGISAVILGLTTPCQRSLDLLREIRAMDSLLPIIIAGGLWSSRDIVAALKNGATDFLCEAHRP